VLVLSRAGIDYLTEMCSGSEAGSYLRLIDFVYHSTLGLRVMKKRRSIDKWPPPRGAGQRPARAGAEREFFIDNLLVRIHFIIVKIRWTGLAFEFPFPGAHGNALLALAHLSHPPGTNTIVVLTSSIVVLTDSRIVLTSSIIVLTSSIVVLTKPQPAGARGNALLALAHLSQHQDCSSVIGAQVD